MSCVAHWWQAVEQLLCTHILYIEVMSPPQRWTALAAAAPVRRPRSTAFATQDDQVLHAAGLQGSTAYATIWQGKRVKGVEKIDHARYVLKVTAAQLKAKAKGKVLFKIAGQHSFTGIAVVP
jgi:hypothetical protein